MIHTYMYLRLAFLDARRIGLVTIVWNSFVMHIRVYVLRAESATVPKEMTLDVPVLKATEEHCVNAMKVK